MTQTQKVQFEGELVSTAVAERAVQDMARRVALLHMCYARVLVDELGEEHGTELVRRAIWRYGALVGQRTRAAVVRAGLVPTVANMDRGADLSPLGFDSERVVIDGEPRSQIRGCPLAQIWSEYGESDLGGLYCDVDPAKMQGYDPQWTMVHTRKEPGGDPFCEIAIRPRSPASQRHKQGDGRSS